MTRTKRLKLAVTVVLALIIIGAVISIAERWPHQFGGHGDPDHMLTDFIATGTSLAPPLPILVVLAIVAFTVGRRDRWGLYATVAVLPLAILMIVGSGGEGLAPATTQVPRGVQWLDGVYGVAAGVLLLLLAIASLRERRIHSLRESQPEPRA